VRRMHGADFLCARIAVHHIVESVDQRAHAFGAAEQFMKGPGRETHQSPFMTLYAAATVPAMSSSPCAVERKPASKAEGARYTPCSSMPWKKRLKRSTSQAMTSRKEVTCFCSVKNNPNMPQTLLITSGTPARFAASS